MRSSIRKIGNSSAVIIPKPMLGELGVAAGDDIEMTMEGGRLMLARVSRPAREGWAEAAQLIAEANDDELAWPEFANDEDQDLEW